MYIEIDFQSDEAIYMQLRNQIILSIADSILREGDSLPPVRQLAGDIGINMHTVNKAYSMLREEGFLTLDRRRGTVVCVSADQARAMQEAELALRPVLAKAVCRGLGREELHELIDRIYDRWE